MVYSNSMGGKMWCESAVIPHAGSTISYVPDMNNEGLQSALFTCRVTCVSYYPNCAYLIAKVNEDNIECQMLQDTDADHPVCDIPAGETVLSYLYADSVNPTEPASLDDPNQQPPVTLASVTFNNFARGTGIASPGTATQGLTATQKRFVASRYGGFIYEQSANIRISQTASDRTTPTEDRERCLVACAQNSACRGAFVRWTDTRVTCTLLSFLGTCTPSNVATIPVSLTSEVSESWYVQGQLDTPVNPICTTPSP